MAEGALPVNETRLAIYLAMLAVTLLLLFLAYTSGLIGGEEHLALVPTR